MIKEKIAKLIDLKSIVTLLITGALIYGFINKMIEADQFITIATMVFMFYFTKKKEDVE
jgi:hypothetical protein